MNSPAIFNELHTLYGSQGWWPLTLIKTPTKAHFSALHIENGVTYGIPWNKLSTFKTRTYDPYFDIATGAILTQNTAWKNVAQALLNLAHHRLLTASAIAHARPRTIEKYIRPSGYFKQKTRKLKLFAEYIQKKYDGDIRRLLKKDMLVARDELLQLWGIGKETADSILLYAGNQPIFVVDAYTKRLCAHYGVARKEYDDYQKLFMTASHIATRCVRNRATYYQEFHAFIVQWGKHYAA
ncbi:MAG: endonuclease [Candidatus Magasanikbacteria bacterium]|nr:endonuclease [Candidatus Magasanikbacteria bacterium]